MNSVLRLLVTLSLLSLLLMGCETKEYAKEDTPAQILNSNSDLDPTETFDGIESVTNVTDLTATLNWTDSEGIGQYKIFDVTDGGMNFMLNVSAPASSYILTGLTSNKTYRIKILAQTSEGRMVNNSAEQEFTTLERPPRPSLARSVPSFLQAKGAERKPTFDIFNLKVGDTAKLFTNSSCNSGTEIATHLVQEGDLDPNWGTLSLRVMDPLTTPGTYTFYVQSINENGVESLCSLANAPTTDYEYQTCPLGYIEVPGDSTVNSNSFCVMQYEARPWLFDFGADGVITSTNELDASADGCKESACTTEDWVASEVTDYKPGSSFDSGTGPLGMPWRMISATQAKAECRALGENYDLISNREWMTIARNIEEQAANWPSGVVGEGCLKRGNIGLSDQCSYLNSTTPLESTNGSSSASLTLSNGNIIYHFSGNVFEWVDMGTGETLTQAPVNCSAAWLGIEIADDFCVGQLSASDYQSDNPGSLTYNFYDKVYAFVETRDALAANRRLYVATDSGVARSDTAKEAYISYGTLNGLGTKDIAGGIAVDDSENIFVGTSKGLYKGVPAVSGGVTNITFTKVLATAINDVFVDSSNNVYAATNGGVAISTNAGMTFTTYNNATNSLANDTVLSLYVDGTTIYAGTAQGLSRSTNGGTSFSTATLADGTTNTLPSNRIESLYVSGGIVYIGTNLGLSFSATPLTDGTYTHKKIADGLGSLLIWDIFVNGVNVYLGTEVGLAISNDSGANFTNVTTIKGLADNTVYDVFVDDDNTLFAATERGLNISNDNGESFVTRTSTDSVGGEYSVGLGQIYGGTGGTAYRGGSYLSGNYAGIYSLSMSAYSNQNFPDAGFRCVFRPD